MTEFIDTLTFSEDRTVEWKYTGRFLQIGELYYKHPITKQIQKYECNRRVTKNQLVDGVLIIPIVKGSAYKEPHILVIRVYRPAMEAYVLSIPAGLVDKGETPLCAALRELKEETGYTGSYINLDLSIPYFCDPWKSNEQQMAYVVEIDMDREENQHPVQQLEEEESILPEIIPVSQLKRYLQDRMEMDRCVVSSPLYILSSILCEDGLFASIDRLGF